jgi:hypothetical protein
LRGKWAPSHSPSSTRMSSGRGSSTTLSGCRASTSSLRTGSEPLNLERKIVSSGAWCSGLDNLGLKLNPDRLFLCAQAQPTRQGSGPSHSASRKEVPSPGTLNTKLHTPNPKPSHSASRKEVLSPGTLNTKLYTPNPKPSRPDNRKEVTSPGTLNTKFWTLNRTSIRKP